MKPDERMIQVRAPADLVEAFSLVAQGHERSFSAELRDAMRVRIAGAINDDAGVDEAPARHDPALAGGGRGPA